MLVFYSVPLYFADYILFSQEHIGLQILKTLSVPTAMMYTFCFITVVYKPFYSSNSNESDDTFTNPGAIL